jgi:DDE superfamily endonuclease
MYQQVEKDQQVLDDWVNMVNNTITTYNIRPDCIVSFDETNCYFDQAKKIGYQLTYIGAKEVNMQTAGNSSRCTIGVGVTGTGDMMTPSVIWCGVNRPSGEVWKEIRKVDNGYPDAEMHYMVQEKGWMDEVGMLEWIRTTWTNFVESKGGPSTTTYLLMDTVSMHKTEKVRHALASLGTIVDFVPPHCTSKLQVCDVSVNAPFQAAIRREYVKFMTHTPDEKIERYVMAHWIARAKGAVTRETIINGFKKIGIYYPKA